MKKYLLPVAVAIIFFFIPFFWLKPGFVDVGGDSARLYFLDPFASAVTKYNNQTVVGAQLYAFVPYELFLAALHAVITSPTYLIDIDRGILLSLAFYSVFLIVTELYALIDSKKNDARNVWVAITAGIVYIGLISNSGWTLSLESYYQIFLNPLIFYLLLKFILTSRFRFAAGILSVSFLYAGNFGYSSTPQLFSFFPLAILYTLLLVRFVYKRPIPWKNIFGLGVLFVGIQGFHLIPVIAAIFGKGNVLHTTIFSNASIQYSGVHYFEVNHESLGKISTQLFQPASWNSQSFLSLFIPTIVLAGFMTVPTLLLGVTGIFFAITLFLVSANITQLGVSLYRMLFYIPGFMMFRSFNEKWYYVYAFFYTLLFAISYSVVLKRKKVIVAIVIGIVIIGSTIYRIIPFLQGKGIYTPHYQSLNVSPVMEVDPDLLSSLKFIRTLPANGSFLTLPLTFPYYQISYGKQGGAYVGVPIIYNLIGRTDYAGFWGFGKYEQSIFDALHSENTALFVRHLSDLQVKYIFRNSDPRIMNNFPGYPYIYPGMTYSSKDQLPIIKDQPSYDKLVAQLHVRKIYEKGFYSVYEFTNAPMYPKATSDPTLHPYFVAGMVVSGLTVLVLCYIFLFHAQRNIYEKKK